MSRRKLGFYIKKRYSRQGNCCDSDQDENELLVHLPLSAFTHGIDRNYPGELIVQYPLSAVRSIQSPDQKCPDELLVQFPLSAFSSSAISDMASLYSRLANGTALPNNWSLSLVQSHMSPSSPLLAVSKLQVTPPLYLCATNTFMLTVSCDTWTLCVGSKFVNKEHCKLLLGFPAALHSVDDVLKIVSSLENSKFCNGNPDNKFNSLSQRHGGLFKDYHGLKTIAYYDNSYHPFPTIRHSNCELVLASNAADRCQQCDYYRLSLHSLASREKSLTSEIPSSNTNHRYLTTPEKISRLRDMSHQAKLSKLAINRLKSKIAETIANQGMILDDETAQDFQEIMADEEKNMKEKEHPEGSFKALFWKQQREATEKSHHGMRWHPLMIRWCIYLRHLSSKAYETLRDSRCIHLPSQRTLRDYTNCVKASAGFSVDVDRQLIQAMSLETCKPWQKLVVLLLDEMHIREGLVFEKSTGRLIGFVDLGDINNHLLAFEDAIKGKNEDECRPLAKSMMAIMVRGLFTPHRFAYAQFPCERITGDLLFQPFWESVYRLERIGVKVLGATFDGASVNRRLVKIHDTSKEHHKVPNIHATDRRSLYFFSDPPHLIKTTRNCWASKSRNLWNDGHYISWQHLVDLYECDKGRGSGLALVPKLKFEHVYKLSSFAKMRVDLAAQVLSESVSKAILLTGGDEAKETAKFVALFDCYFDLLNVRNFTNGTRKRKNFQHPYRHADDYRLDWLEGTFLVYLDKWESSVKTLLTHLTKSQQQRMLLSAETRLGLRMTAQSFIGFVKQLFSLPEVKGQKLAFLSGNICQDPLENFFGCQRQRGGTSDNPNVKEYYQNTQALRVMNSFCRGPVRGNCRGGNAEEPIHDGVCLPIPKRHRIK